MDTSPQKKSDSTSYATSGGTKRSEGVGRTNEEQSGTELKRTFAPLRAKFYPETGQWRRNRRK